MPEIRLLGTCPGEGPHGTRAKSSKLAKLSNSRNDGHDPQKATHVWKVDLELLSGSDDSAGSDVQWRLSCESMRFGWISGDDRNNTEKRCDKRDATIVA